MVLLGLQMAKIVVRVVDANDNSITTKPVMLKPEPPPKTRECRELLAAGYGQGLLLDEGGYGVTSEELQGGNYMYCVTGECTMQQGRSITHMPPCCQHEHQHPHHVSCT